MTTEAQQLPDETARAHPRLALVLALLFIAGSFAFAVGDSSPITAGVLLCAAVAIASEIAGVRYSRNLTITGSEVSFVLAAVISGPRPAIAIAGLACIAGYLTDPYRPRVLIINLAVYMAPVAAGAALLASVDGDITAGGTAAVIAIVATAIIVVAGGALLIISLMTLFDGGLLRDIVLSLRSVAASQGFQALFIIATAVTYVEVGVVALGLVIVIAAAAAYMTRLVVRARDRTRAYADLSWGLLSGLIRTLDARDARAARHCAAVARFSRDIAATAGFPQHEQELAHTAGLLHDIGRFALSDRVMDRGVQLQPDDWRAIRRHPDIGAELLKDIDLYGPIADIIRAHHERPDGRGYPRQLTATQIPELAKVVAVAEVYDTLTAPDTYRTPMTSFEAVNELRRVAGTQLDSTYVEHLASLLAGQGTDYRHAEGADFDAELDIERRINEAASR